MSVFDRFPFCCYCFGRTTTVSFEDDPRSGNPTEVVQSQPKGETGVGLKDINVSVDGDQTSEVIVNQHHEAPVKPSVVKDLSGIVFPRVQKGIASIEFVDHTNNEVKGYLSVLKNPPVENVVARYTVNGSGSYRDVMAQWSESTDPRLRDKLSFTIPSLVAPYNVCFAIRYELQGEFYWDSYYYKVVHT